ncbi:MAG: hypothetical protein HN730_07580 [Bdellovibrionales bacterium]|nr:hypothetical protein [Bdellovibrionales bacterium]
MFKIKLGYKTVIASSFTVLIVHFTMRMGQFSIAGLNPYYWTNPGVTAVIALISAAVLVGIIKVSEQIRVKS